MYEFRSITVGQASAIISAATASAQALLLLIFPLILVAYLGPTFRDVKQRAITWSAINRALHSSWWPTILGSDSTSVKGVAIPVTFITYATLMVTILATITAVVTPLGLYEVILPSEQVLVPFQYAPDTSRIGYGTAPRFSDPFARICGGGQSKSRCPGFSFSGLPPDPSTNLSLEKSDHPGWYDTRVPEYIKDFYSSGLENFNRSVSSFFDIQWRHHSLANVQEANTTSATTGLVSFNNGSGYYVGSYRPLSVIVANDAWELAEGLIIDTKSGGIGFRNHSLPPQTTYGSMWSEDILFIQPQTECVDVNLTIEFTVINGGFSIKTMKLVDNGGFANLNANAEWWTAGNKNSQEDPSLQRRAYNAAWLYNAFQMSILNVTAPDFLKNDSNNKPQPLPYINSTTGFSFVMKDRVNISSEYKPDIGTLQLVRNHQLSDLLIDFRGNSSVTVKSSKSTVPFYKNPHNITDDSFELIQNQCIGVNFTDMADMSSVGRACGFIYSTPRVTTHPDDVFYTVKDSDTLEHSIYSCVSAAKVLIKNVTFQYNGSVGLDGVTVLDIQEKVYSQDKEKPLWAVENSNLTFMDIEPLWGIVSNRYENSSNITTIRREHLWLSGYDDLTGVAGSGQYVPAASFATRALAGMYGGSAGITKDFETDYTGLKDFSMYRRWFDLSKNPKDAAKILNLIWTDIAANAVLGTRGWASTASFPVKGHDSAEKKLVPVTMYQRHLRYRFIYGIPAFLLAATLVVMCLGGTVLFILRKTSIGQMRWWLNQTSLGRNLTSLIYAETSSQQITTLAWKTRDGLKNVTFTPTRPYEGPVETVSQDGIQAPANDKEATSFLTPVSERQSQ